MTFLLTLMGWGSTIKSFLAKLPWQFYAALAGALAFLLFWHLHTGWQKDAYNLAWTTGRDAAAKAFNEAQAKADAAARAHRTITVAKQATISKETTDAFAQATDDIDARAAQLRVRRDAALARDRARRASDPNAASPTATGAVEAPAQDGLAWDVAYPLMVQAAKNEAQLNAILDWEAKQQALDDAEPKE